ncbi:hypothetical protein J3Q64DRAFT_1331377 [Phycomyces blakesleeanus]|uniref:Borealin N-terminal domain-containing protein n=1 Tax=Phycomyces blakesleeanus TaxID=4837 RepID=A0ABR3B8E8_PHYBL
MTGSLSDNSQKRSSYIDQIGLQETKATIQAECKNASLESNLVFIVCYSILPAKRRIEGLRQNIEFACTSLRAHGNMQINQLLPSVRQLTMDEFCNRYGADTLTFLEEQTRKRRGEDVHNILQKRSLGPSVEKKDNSKLAPKVDSPRIAKERDNPPVTRSGQAQSFLRSNNSRSFDTKLQESQSKVKPKSKTRSQQQQQQQQQQSQPQRQKSREVESNQGENTGNLKDISGTRSSPGKQLKYDEQQPEVDCGPLFVHFKREKHPKITLRLNSQQEASEFSPFEISAPTEIFEKLGDQQRRRIVDQIQDIQDQLESLKQQLK